MLGSTDKYDVSLFSGVLRGGHHHLAKLVEVHRAGAVLVDLCDDPGKVLFGQVWVHLEREDEENEERKSRSRSRSSQGQVKVKSRSSEGQVNSWSSLGQVKVKVKLCKLYETPAWEQS